MCIPMTFRILKYRCAFRALARLSPDFQAATRGGAISIDSRSAIRLIRTPKKQSRVINKETPTSSRARRVRFPRDCIVRFISEGVYLTGWLFHAADHCYRCRLIITRGKVSYRSRSTRGTDLSFTRGAQLRSTVRVTRS